MMLAPCPLSWSHQPTPDYAYSVLTHMPPQPDDASLNNPHVHSVTPHTPPQPDDASLKNSHGATTVALTLTPRGQTNMDNPAEYG